MGATGQVVYNPAMPARTPGATPDRGDQPDRLHVRIFRVAHVVIDDQWRSADVRDPFWRLYVNDRDGAALELPGERRPFLLAPGRAHLVPAWVRFTCRCDRPVGHFYVHFDVAGLTGVMVRRLFPTPVTLGHDAAVVTLTSALAPRVTETGRAGPAEVLATKAAVNLALAALLTELPPGVTARLWSSAAVPDAVAPAVRYIDTHLSQPLDNAQLARLCHLSPDHFIRTFRTALGQTPRQYVLERRVAAASRRLMMGRDSIDQVAARYGFADRFHFSRVFKRVMGQSPAGYRSAMVV